MVSKERLFYLIILSLLSYVIYYLFNYNEEYVVRYNQKVNTLTQKVDSLHFANSELIYKIDTLNLQIHKLDKDIIFKSSEINNLQNEINKKMDAVNSFTRRELKQFFTKRYRQHFDSIRRTNNTSGN